MFISTTVLAPGDPTVNLGVGELGISSNLVINSGANLLYDSGIGDSEHVALDGNLVISSNVLVTINLAEANLQDTEWMFPLISAMSLSGGSNVVSWACTNAVYDFTAYVVGNEIWVKRPAPALLMILR